MNTKNNKRRRESVIKIEKAFVEMLQTKELMEISVMEICKQTGLNRSTFYANYLDIYDLADKMKAKMEAEFSDLFPKDEDMSAFESYGALTMFRHIKDNRLFYKTYFKLGYDQSNQIFIYDIDRAEKDFDNTHIDYHIEFFRNGLNAIIKKWLANDCKESPEEMADILKREYRGR